MLWAKEHHRLFSESPDDNHVQKLLRDVRQTYRYDPEFDCHALFLSVMVECDNFPVEHSALQGEFSALDLSPSAATASCKLASSPFAESFLLSLSSTFFGAISSLRALTTSSF